MRRRTLFIALLVICAAYMMSACESSETPVNNTCVYDNSSIEGVNLHCVTIETLAADAAAKQSECETAGSYGGQQAAGTWTVGESCEDRDVTYNGSCTIGGIEDFVEYGGCEPGGPGNVTGPYACESISGGVWTCYLSPIYCFFDNVFAVGTWTCKEFAPLSDPAQAEIDCTTDYSFGANNGATATFGIGTCDAAYTSSCTYDNGDVDYFPGGNCDGYEVQYSNHWGCHFGGGSFACLLEIPTGNYEATAGFIHSLETAGGLISGTVTPPDSWCADDVEYDIVGQLVDDPDPLQGEASIMYTASLPEGEDCGWVPTVMCLALEDISPSQDGSILDGTWSNCEDPENPGDPGPMQLTLIEE